MDSTLILKFDIKSGAENEMDTLRCDMYKSINVRVTGRCKENYSEGLSKANVKFLLDDLFLQLNEQFDIGFKSNSVKAINAWVKKNIRRVHVRENVPKIISDAIFKRAGDGTVFVKD